MVIINFHLDSKYKKDLIEFKIDKINEILKEYLYQLCGKLIKEIIDTIVSEISVTVLYTEKLYFNNLRYYNPDEIGFILPNSIELVSGFYLY